MNPCQVDALNDCPFSPDRNDYAGHFAVRWMAASGTAILLVNATELLFFVDELSKPCVLMPIAEC